MGVLISTKTLLDGLNLVSALGLPDAVLYTPSKITVSSISAGEFALVPKVDLPKVPIASETLLQKVKKIASKSQVVELEENDETPELIFYVGANKEAQKQISDALKENYILPADLKSLLKRNAIVKLQPIMSLAMSDLPEKELEQVKAIKPKIEIPQLVLQLVDTDAKLEVRDGERLVIVNEDASKAATFEFDVEELQELTSEQRQNFEAGLPASTIKLLSGLNGTIKLDADEQKLQFVIETETYMVFFKQEKVVVSTEEEFSEFKLF